MLIFIDEIQLIPKLLNEVHRAIEDFQTQCTFLLTGSSARKLKRENANLLAGRAIRCDFFPISHQEYDFNAHLDQILQWGSLPKALLTKSDAIKTAYLETYVHTYLREEIQRESEIRNLEAFSRFLELAAVYNSKPINFAKIGRAAGVDGKTIKEYFSVLEDTLVAFTLPAWSFSIARQLQSAPKIYLFDNGVINALTGDLRAELSPATYRYGVLFENLVINEINRLRSFEFPDISLYHYRTLNGVEIDVILQKNISTSPVAVEIKSQSAPTLSDVKGLHQFNQDHPEAPRYVICQTPTRYVLEGVVFLPLVEGIKEVLTAARR